MGYKKAEFRIVKTAGQCTATPETNNTTGDDLLIYPNSIDTTTYARINGAGEIILVVPSSSSIQLQQGANVTTYFDANATDSGLKTLANRNILLSPHGTGQVKFGTYTAGAATDSTGYITILDAAGNTRKLMVQA